MHRWLPDRSDTYWGGRSGKITDRDSEVTCEGCLEPVPVRLAAYRIGEVLDSRGNPDILREALMHIVDNESSPERLEQVGRLVVPARRARKKAEVLRSQEEADRVAQLPVTGLGHVVNHWKENGAPVGACEVCGGRWDFLPPPGTCRGGPRPGADIRRVRCRHCKIRPVILEVQESESGERFITWLTDSATCRSCRERVCSSNCPVGCPAAGREDKEESIEN